MYGPEAALAPHLLEPVGSRQILRRMLANLKGIYLQRRDHLQALAVVEHLIRLYPDQSQEQRDKGMLLLSLQRHGPALAALEIYLAATPAPPDAGLIRRLVQEVRARTGDVDG